MNDNIEKLQEEMDILSDLENIGFDNDTIEAIIDTELYPERLHTLHSWEEWGI